MEKYIFGNIGVFTGIFVVGNLYCSLFGITFGMFL